jgi:hypothetical protein
MRGESVKLFFGPDFAHGAMISTWTPQRISTSIRCQACGRMAAYERSQGLCTCGERLPEPPY